MQLFKKRGNFILKSEKKIKVNQLEKENKNMIRKWENSKKKNCIEINKFDAKYALKVSSYYLSWLLTNGKVT